MGGNDGEDRDLGAKSPRETLGQADIVFPGLAHRHADEEAVGKGGGPGND
jgi:hypothetical protein